MMMKKELFTAYQQKYLSLSIYLSIEIYLSLSRSVYIYLYMSRSIYLSIYLSILVYSYLYVFNTIVISIDPNLFKNIIVISSLSIY